MNYQDSDLALTLPSNTGNFNLKDFTDAYTDIQNYINGTRTKIGSMVTDIGSKVSTSTYTTKMTSLDSSITSLRNKTANLSPDSSTYSGKANTAGTADYASALGEGSNVYTYPTLHAQLLGITTLIETVGELSKRISGKPSFEPTFIIDTQEKATQWENNETGNDYTSILFKSGTYNFTKELNLTPLGTKRIVGEGTAILKLPNGQSKNMFYDTLPTTDEYYMININVHKSSGGYGALMSNMRNLYYVNGKDLVDGGNYGYIFSNCKNLYYCDAQRNLTYLYSSFPRRSLYQSCSNLIGCTGKMTQSTSSGVSSDNTWIGGFVHCSFLKDCSCEMSYSSSISDSLRVYAYNSCTLIHNCSHTGNKGFSNCYAIK